MISHSSFDPSSSTSKHANSYTQEVSKSRTQPEIRITSFPPLHPSTSSTSSLKSARQTYTPNNGIPTPPGGEMVGFGGVQIGDLEYELGLTVDQVRAVQRESLGVFSCNWIGCDAVLASGGVLCRHVQRHVSDTFTVDEPKPPDDVGHDDADDDEESVVDLSYPPGNKPCEWKGFSFSSPLEMELLIHVTNTHVERVIISYCPFLVCPARNTAHSLSHFTEHHRVRPWSRFDLNPTPAPVLRPPTTLLPPISSLPRDVPSYLLSTLPVKSYRPFLTTPPQNPLHIRLRFPNNPKPRSTTGAPRLSDLTNKIMIDRSNPDIPFWPMCGDAHNFENDSSSIFPSIHDLDDSIDIEIRNFVRKSEVNVGKRRWELPKMIYPLDLFGQLKVEKDKAEKEAKAKGEIFVWGVQKRTTSEVEFGLHGKKDGKSGPLKRPREEREERAQKRLARDRLNLNFDSPLGNGDGNDGMEVDVPPRAESQLPTPPASSSTPTPNYTPPSSSSPTFSSDPIPMPNISSTPPLFTPTPPPDTIQVTSSSTSVSPLQNSHKTRWSAEKITRVADRLVGQEGKRGIKILRRRLEFEQGLEDAIKELEGEGEVRDEVQEPGEMDGKEVDIQVKVCVGGELAIESPATEGTAVNTAGL